MRRHPAARSAARMRLVPALLAVVLAGTACGGPQVLDGSGRFVRASPRPAVAPASSSGASTPATSRSPAAGQAVSPGLQLLRRLRTASTASWPDLTDPRTGVRFSLPSSVAPRTTLQSGVSQRIYENKLTEQSSISVSYIHAVSVAAARSLLDLYPTQLQSSVRALGADDPAITERRTGAIGGATTLSFRLTFTPTTIPQIPPVWLVMSVADGPDIVLAQTIVFPPVVAYDYLPAVREVQRRLVASLRPSG